MCESVSKLHFCIYSSSWCLTRMVSFGVLIFALGKMPVGILQRVRGCTKTETPLRQIQSSSLVHLALGILAEFLCSSLRVVQFIKQMFLFVVFPLVFHTVFRTSQTFVCPAPESVAVLWSTSAGSPSSDGVDVQEFFNNLNGKRIWKRRNVCIFLTESLCDIPETNTML